MKAKLWTLIYEAASNTQAFKTRWEKIIRKPLSSVLPVDETKRTIGLNFTPDYPTRVCMSVMLRSDSDIYGGKINPENQQLYQAYQDLHGTCNELLTGKNGLTNKQKDASAKLVKTISKTF